MGNLVAIYIRVSTLDQAREGYSLDAQEKTLRKWCADHGHEVYDLYADRGISGKDIDHRPEMQRLLQDAKQEKFNIVIFWALSRFTRSVSDLYQTMELLQEHNIGMVSYTEAFDTSTPMGRAMIGVVGVFAQLERELTGERIKAALDERAMQGKLTFNNILGYNRTGKTTCEINPAEAEYVNFVHDNYVKYKNLTKVAALAEEKGYRGKRGCKPSTASILAILTHPVYAGYNIFHGELHKSDHEPIRTVKQFNEVQRLILSSKVSGQPRKTKLYILPENDE